MRLPCSSGTVIMLIQSYGYTLELQYVIHQFTYKQLSLSDKNVNSLFRQGFLSYSIHKNILFTILSYPNHIWAFFLAESILLLYIAAQFPSNLSDTSLLQA